jgi:APA family basic amino acid/polyamine antiporter
VTPDPVATDRSSQQQTGLRRGLGLGDCTLLVVGSMVGSGIFLTNAHIAASLPSAWLILSAWLLGGIMALTGALSYAELGASLPRAGGHYVYLREAYGPLVGFFDGWLSFVASFPGSIAFVSLALLAYLPSSWTGGPLLATSVFGLEWALGSRQLIAAGIILGLSGINALGLRAGAGTQNLLTGLKIAALLGIAAFALASGRGRWENFSAGTQWEIGLAGLGGALVGVSFSYLGWDAATYMAAETKRPQLNIPRSLALGTLGVVLLYLLFNVGVFYGVGAREMAAVENPTQVAVARLLGPTWSGLLTAVIVVCILGSLNATVMVGPRIYYAMSRDGLFPGAFGSVGARTRVPVAAIAAQAIWACVIVFSATLGRILAFTVLVIWLLSAITGAAVFVLRVRRPQLERPYRVRGYPIVPAVFCLSSLGLGINHLRSTPVDLLWLAGFLAAGLPVYAWLRRGEAARQASALSNDVGQT